MGFRCGIVGLPNVGKSTLFNAITSSVSAQVANFPFCTIAPNTGCVAVPDGRLLALAEVEKSQKIIPTQLEFVDIAGLVKGASQGEGLGNQFLSNIRETDAIIHVLRCFEEDDITHVYTNIDPVRDAEIIELELILSDLESLERQKENLVKKSKKKMDGLQEKFDTMEGILSLLKEGKNAREYVAKTEDENKYIREFFLLSQKPVLYICNVEEEKGDQGNALSQKVLAWAQERKAQGIVISAKIESEVALLADEKEKKAFLDALGLSETGLSKIIRASYALLNLITFFTVGPKEARAWTIQKCMKAPQAAGIIHTDFEKGFIRAETISYTDYIACQGLTGAKDQGKMRVEGKDYSVQDGDVFHFLFHV